MKTDVDSCFIQTIQNVTRRSKTVQFSDRRCDCLLYTSDAADE